MNYERIDTRLLLVNTPSRITVCGPSGSGKTEWIKRFLNQHETIVGFKFDTILYVYGVHQKLYEDIGAQNPNIKWCEGFCKDIIEKELNQTDDPKLLIIDDLVQEVANDKFFHAFYVRASHHWNVTIIFTTQYLYQKGLRLVNLNTTHYILYKSLRDKTSVRTLGMQIYPSNWREFMKIYEQSTRYIIIMIYCIIEYAAI